MSDTINTYVIDNLNKVSIVNIIVCFCFKCLVMLSYAKDFESCFEIAF